MDLQLITPEASRYPSSGRDPRLALSKRIYLSMRNMLMVGGFAPGQGVSLRSLAARLGTSAMPVREAVNRLIAEGALQMLPNRHVIVPLMSRERFSEITLLRQNLEAMAAAAACRKMEGDTREMEGLCARGLEALESDDIDAILATNKDFHFCLYEASGYAVTVSLIEGLWMQMGPFLRLSLAAGRQRWDGHQHVAVVDALRRRDAEAIAEAVRLDIGLAADVLFEINAFDAPDAPAAAAQSN